MNQVTAIPNTAPTSRVNLTRVVALLPRALQRVVQRNSTPGPDRQKASDYAANPENLQALAHELQSGQYRPRPSQRLWLAKPHGGTRPAVNACTRDKVVATALNLALVEVLDQDSDPVSFAYAEGLGPLRAANRLIDHRNAGRVWVVRADYRNCFESVPHREMLEALRPHVAEDALWLFVLFLRLPVQDGGATYHLEVGLPQGLAISPTLANLYLKPGDEVIARRGWGLVRYADDFAIATPTAGQAGLALEVAEAAAARLKMQLNPDKTSICSFAKGFNFLGFRFQGDSVRIDPDRIEEFKTHLNHLLVPSFGSAQPDAVRQANDLIRGWRNYFGLGNVHLDFAALDRWIEERFGPKAAVLERLTPRPTHAQPPTLGGYPSRREKRQAAQRPATESSQTTAAVILRAHQLPPLSSSPHLEATLAELTKASLYHRATLCAHWSAQGNIAAQNAISMLAKAMAGKLPHKEAKDAYELALLAACPPGLDARPPRGTLRRALAEECWAALLEAGLPLGVERVGAVPGLALALADAYLAPVADFALIGALRLGNVRKPQSQLTKQLDQPVRYREGQHWSWRAILRSEAGLIRDALEGGQSYTVWLWGAS